MKHFNKSMEDVVDAFLRVRNNFIIILNSVVVTWRRPGISWRDGASLSGPLLKISHWQSKI